MAAFVEGRLKNNGGTPVEPAAPHASVLKLHGKEHVTAAVPTDGGRTLLSLGYDGRLAECHVDLVACDGAVRLEVVLDIALPIPSLTSHGGATG